MAPDLASRQDGIPERFVPGEMKGQLIEAEHLARYRWAAALAQRRRILDAGCGTAYGAAMLAMAGADLVVGVDIAEGVLASVRDDMPESVHLQVADVRELPHQNASFDLVVCFEVIEHFEEPLPVLDELARVLTADGVLLVSSPNRGIYPPSNPHHHHEFRPDELAAELRKRLPNVRLMRQQAYLSTAILSDERFVSAEDDALDGVRSHKVVEGLIDEEMFTLAIAGRGELPNMPSSLLLTSELETRRLLAFPDEQETSLQAHRQHIHELEQRVANLDQVQQRLIDLEQDLARVPELELRLESVLAEAKVMGERLTGTEQVLGDVMGSPSWRVTEPLRTVKRLLGKSRRQAAADS